MNAIIYDAAIKSMQARIAEIKADERLHEPPATIFVNAPLALTQLQLETELRTLQGALRSLDELESSHEPK